MTFWKTVYSSLIQVALLALIGLLNAHPGVAQATTERRTVYGLNEGQGCGLDIAFNYSEANRVVFYNLINRCPSTLRGRVVSDTGAEDQFFVDGSQRTSRTWITGRTIVRVEVEEAGGPDASGRVSTTDPAFASLISGARASLERNLTLLRRYAGQGRSEYASDNHAGRATSEYADAVRDAQGRADLLQGLLEEAERGAYVSAARLQREVEALEASVETLGRLAWRSVPSDNYDTLAGWNDRVLPSDTQAAQQLSSFEEITRWLDRFIESRGRVTTNAEYGFAWESQFYSRRRCEFNLGLVRTHQISATARETRQWWSTVDLSQVETVYASEAVQWARVVFTAGETGFQVRYTPWTRDGEFRSSEETSESSFTLVLEDLDSAQRVVNASRDAMRHCGRPRSLY